MTHYPSYQSNLCTTRTLSFSSPSSLKSNSNQWNHFQLSNSLHQNSPTSKKKIRENQNMMRSFSFSLRILLLILSFLQTSFVSSNQNLSSNMDPLELESLFKIMESLSSDQNWRVSYPNPCQPGSSWPGIECKFTGSDNRFHVTRLDFGVPPNPTCKNAAKFPSEIFHLPNLESIFIFQCFTQTPTRIKVSPDEILSSHLQQIGFKSNSALIGTIPPQFSSLKSLQILTLSQNKLTGQIPAEIFSLNSLLRLDLSYNILTGSIPSQVGNLRNLVGLDLSYNKLSWPIPSRIGDLGSLQKLDLSSNSLTGTVPESVQHLSSLVFLALSNNKLRGHFPKGVTNLQNLQYFLMDDNPMYVPLPSEFGQLKKLQELRLSSSGYSGPIPSTYSQLTNLTTLSLQNNRLSGKIPDEFGNLSHIYHLNLSKNLLDGVVPFNSSFLKRLGRNLDLSGNSGLCLSPSAGNGFHLGINVCGNDKSSSLMTPLRKSEAPLLFTRLFISVAALVLLTLHHILYSG